MRRTMTQKIICMFVAILFLINDVCFGLGVMPGSTQPRTKDAMYALGQKLFATKRGPGSIDFDKYKPGTFVGKAPKIAGYKFVKADYDNPPKSWVNNPILQKTDLIEALKYFRDHEARIPVDLLDVKEGYFEVDEDQGELPIARIEKTKEAGRYRYTLIIHTKFVQMWNHIRQNDVWFEDSHFYSNGIRTASVAWGVFYRLAKHEMADLAKEGLKMKNNGHIAFAPDPKDHFTRSLSINKSEEEANTVRGNYFFDNDAIWMWFLGAYCFGNPTRYNNKILRQRAEWFFAGNEEDLSGEFPILRNAPSLRRAAHSLACAINFYFFSRPGISVPEFVVDSKYIKEYKARKEARKAAGITEAPLYAAGADKKGVERKREDRRVIIGSSHPATGAEKSDKDIVRQKLRELRKKETSEILLTELAKIAGLSVEKICEAISAINEKLLPGGKFEIVSDKVILKKPDPSDRQRVEGYLRGRSTPIMLEAAMRGTDLNDEQIRNALATMNKDSNDPPVIVRDKAGKKEVMLIMRRSQVKKEEKELNVPPAQSDEVVRKVAVKEVAPTKESIPPAVKPIDGASHTSTVSTAETIRGPVKESRTPPTLPVKQKAIVIDHPKTQELKLVQPATVVYDKKKHVLMITLHGGISDAVYAIVNLANNKGIVYEHEGGTVLLKGPKREEALRLIAREVSYAHKVIGKSTTQVSTGVISDEDIALMLSSPPEDEKSSEKPPVPEKFIAPVDERPTPAAKVQPNKGVKTKPRSGPAEHGLSKGTRFLITPEDRLNQKLPAPAPTQARVTKAASLAALTHAHIVLAALAEPDRSAVHEKWLKEHGVNDVSYGHIGFSMLPALANEGKQLARGEDKQAFENYVKGTRDAASIARLKGDSTVEINALFCLIYVNRYNPEDLKKLEELVDEAEKPKTPAQAPAANVHDAPRITVKSSDTTNESVAVKVNRYEDTELQIPVQPQNVVNVHGSGDNLMDLAREAAFRRDDMDKGLRTGSMAMIDNKAAKEQEISALEKQFTETLEAYQDRETLEDVLARLENSQSAAGKEGYYEPFIQQLKAKITASNHILIQVISEYIVRLGLDKGPGSEKLSINDLENIYKTVGLLENSQIEIFVPQQLKLTEDMQKAIKDIGKRKNRTPVICRQYSDLPGLAKMLESPGSAKRIIITNITDETSQDDMVLFVKKYTRLFELTRLLNIATPTNYQNMDNPEKTVYQAKIVTIAIFARLFEKDKTPMVESLLRYMVKGCLDVDDRGMDAFMSELGRPEDGAGLEYQELVNRILFLLGKTVKLVEKIGQEIQLMKNFWIAA